MTTIDNWGSAITSSLAFHGHYHLGLAGGAPAPLAGFGSAKVGVVHLERLEALPPYSPQLNPVEHIWDEIREKWFANKVYNSLDAAEDRLVEALVALENDRELVASTTGCEWIINGL